MFSQDRASIEGVVLLPLILLLSVHFGIGIRMALTRIAELRIHDFRSSLFEDASLRFPCFCGTILLRFDEIRLRLASAKRRLAAFLVVRTILGEFFFVSRLLGVVYAAGSKIKSTHTEHERVQFWGTTEHERGPYTHATRQNTH